MDNSIILHLSDNGACAMGGDERSVNAGIEIRMQYHLVLDIVLTVLEILEIEEPSKVNGGDQILICKKILA